MRRQSCSGEFRKPTHDALSTDHTFTSSVLSSRENRKHNDTSNTFADILTAYYNPHNSPLFAALSKGPKSSNISSLPTLSPASVAQQLLNLELSAAPRYSETSRPPLAVKCQSSYTQHRSSTKTKTLSPTLHLRHILPSLGLNCWAICTSRYCASGAPFAW
jgi:hypothetical protein